VKLFIRKSGILTLFPPVAVVPDDTPVFCDPAVRDNRDAALLISNLHSKLLIDPHGDFGCSKLYHLGHYLDDQLRSIFADSDASLEEGS
jgi:hypothetical protein